MNRNYVIKSIIKESIDEGIVKPVAPLYIDTGFARVGLKDV